jgi:ABC-type phosphate transport system auxiliary subunit
MESGAVQGMNETYEALAQVKSVRVQLKELTPKTNAKLADSLAALDKKCAQLEGATQSGFFGLPPSGKQPENFSTLNQHFSSMLGTADSGDVAPTTQATAAFAELQQSASDLHKQWSDCVEREVPELNKDLKKAHLAEIDPKKALAEKLGGAADGDDEP